MTYDERTQAEVEALLSTATKKEEKDDRPSFSLDPSQQAAVEKIKEWFSKDSPIFFVLSGRAGTGKSTIISEVIRSLKLKEGEVKYLAPTGKAVSVLRSKGIPQAMTIHKYVYRFNGSNSKLMKSLNDKSEIIRLCDEGQHDAARAILDNIAEVNRKRKQPKLYFASRKVNGLSRTKLIVVDEASMINDDEIEDIISLNVKVIFVGDNAQLPPVEGTNSMMQNPDAQITEIHRQGKDSNIIKFANLIMENKDLSFLNDWKDTEDVHVIYDIGVGDFDAFIKSRQWQFLTVTNREKDHINARARSLLGYANHKFPMKGEILLARGGHRDTGIVNGIQGEVLDDFVEFDLEYNGAVFGSIQGRVKLLDGTNKIVTVTMKRNAFISGNLYDFEHWESLWEYGYAMTVHKSQGSSWENVFYVYEDCLDCDQNLNYTAVTRASKNLIFLYQQ